MHLSCEFVNQTNMQKISTKSKKGKYLTPVWLSEDKGLIINALSLRHSDNVCSRILKSNTASPATKPGAHILLCDFASSLYVCLLFPRFVGRW